MLYSLAASRPCALHPGGDRRHLRGLAVRRRRQQGPFFVSLFRVRGSITRTAQVQIPGTVNTDVPFCRAGGALVPPARTSRRCALISLLCVRRSTRAHVGPVEVYLCGHRALVEAHITGTVNRTCRGIEEETVHIAFSLVTSSECTFALTSAHIFWPHI